MGFAVQSLPEARNPYITLSAMVRMNDRRAYILFSCLVAHASFAQGFVNLNFESATIVPIPNDPFERVQFGAAFPGWMAYYNSSAFSSTTPMLHNSLFLGGLSTLGLLDQNHSAGGVFSNFTAVLQGGSPSNSADVSLAQTGVVPNGTASLRFFAAQSFNRPIVVSLNGQLLTPIVLQNLGLFREYGADISPFAGQMAELRFTQLHGPGNDNNLFLDNISFSPVAVPEPSTWALLGVGSLLFWCAARWRRG